MAVNLEAMVAGASARFIPDEQTSETGRPMGVITIDPVSKSGVDNLPYEQQVELQKSLLYFFGCVACAQCALVGTMTEVQEAEVGEGVVCAGVCTRESIAWPHDKNEEPEYANGQLCEQFAPDKSKSGVSIHWGQFPTMSYDPDMDISNALAQAPCRAQVDII